MALKRGQEHWNKASTNPTSTSPRSSLHDSYKARAMQLRGWSRATVPAAHPQPVEDDTFSQQRRIFASSYVVCGHVTTAKYGIGSSRFRSLIYRWDYSQLFQRRKNCTVMWKLYLWNQSFFFLWFIRKIVKTKEIWFAWLIVVLESLVKCKNMKSEMKKYFLIFIAIRFYRTVIFSLIKCR